MGSLHFEVTISQSPKYSNALSGDVCIFKKTDTATYVILCDGLGKGIKANVAANFCASRIQKLLDAGFSIRETFSRVVKTMNNARHTDMPYAVFTIVKILSDGNATVLSYEMPLPIFIANKFADTLPGRTKSVDNSLIYEAQCEMQSSDTIFVVSDGISQSGMGKGLQKGWEIENIAKYINVLMSEKITMGQLPEAIKEKARELWQNRYEDDCTAVAIQCRKAKTVSMFTGPPKEKSQDAEVTNRFLSNDGLRIVCGATTAKIVAEYLNEELEVNNDNINAFTPPEYEIEGIDLVTEGAVTLTQLLNIWDVPFEKLQRNNPVSDLYAYLQISDVVNFYVGCSENVANEDISFKQIGILSRKKIIPMLEEKLKERGKVVTVHYY